MALIVVQAGHTFRKTGATGTNGLDGDPNEQEFAWAAAQECNRLIRAAGHDVRVITADVPLDDYRGHGFVAIHCDGSIYPSARGASVGYRNPNGARFASLWKVGYHARGQEVWRPDNYTEALAGYYGCRNASTVGTPYAFIAEAGFLTNPDEEQALSLPHGPVRFALAVTDAVTALFGGSLPQEDDLPYSVEDLRNIIRSVLDEGTGVGQIGWSNTSKATLAGIQHLHNLVAAQRIDVDDLVARIVAALPTGGQPLTRTEVRQAVVDGITQVSEAAELALTQPDPVIQPDQGVQPS